MKNIKILFSLAIIFSLSIISCDESTIELDPIGDTEAGYFKTESQMEAGIMGIYQKINFFYTFRAQNWLTGIFLLPGDNLSTQGSEGYETFVTINGSDGKLQDYYRYAYQLIARANVMLQKIEENADVAYNIQPELKDYHTGEALFLKSWMYFMLWNLYGTAPLVPERITNLDDAYPPNSTGTELLDAAIVDLKEAITLLPDSWDADNLGRVTKNSARGMAAKLLVFRGHVNNNDADFTEAIGLIDNITGVALTANYGDNFSVQHENNVESLFEFQANDQAQETNTYLDNDEFSVIGDMSAFIGYYVNSPEWLGNSVYTATEAFKNAIEPGDPRTDYIVDLTDGNFTNVLKYNRDGQRVDGWADYWDANINNMRILRYADVLLLKAEALVRSGGSPSDAIGLINQIRTRARFSTTDGTEAAVPADLDVSETNSGVILDWIFEERRVELCFEDGNRWFDLRRRHMAGEIDLTSWNFSSLKSNFAFASHNIVFPLPEAEVVQNPNLNQNTGY